jgi:GR25 family glycosyltransferase involved in LPS biosynthesis
MKQPKTFCIALKDHPRSTALLADCLSSAKIYNWNIEIFWGINGKEINVDIWNSLGILPPQSRKFRSSLGMQGCFLSHFILWKKCLELQEPFIILEHDAILTGPPENFDNEFNLVKLHHPTSKIKHNDATGYWNFGTHGYYIKPEGADKLILWVQQNYPYNPDILIGSFVLNWRNLNKDIVLINKDTISTTTNL